MPNIFFPGHDISADALPASSPQFSALAQFNALNCAKLHANMPYCTSSHPCGRGITQSISALPPQTRQNLVRTVDHFGDQTSALASIYERHFLNLELQPMVGVAGAAASSLDNRLTALQKALLQYQQALLQLNGHNGVGRVAGARKSELKAQVRSRYETLQNQFRLELKKLTPVHHLGKNRGSALVSAERGLTLADQRRSRQLFVADGKQAVSLGKLAKGTRYAGNGLVALDAGLRAQEVHRVYSNGGNWQREAAVQATGFGFGAALGIAVGKAAVGGLITIGLGLTPVGWAILIVAGASAGLAASTAGDALGKGVAGSIYDRDF